MGLSTDRQTRISLFAMNIGPAFGDPDAVVSADAEDADQNLYPLQVEYFSELQLYTGYTWWSSD
jgi:hypothetical protein